jgi:hypothetical protein
MSNPNNLNSVIGFPNIAFSSAAPVLDHHLAVLPGERSAFTLSLSGPLI